MSDYVTKTHNSETSIKAPECLLKQQICHHCTNCHGDKVRSQTYWYYQCMSVCSLPFTQLPEKTEWKGDSTSLGWLGSMQAFKLFFCFPAALHTCSRRTSCWSSPDSESVCSLLLCSICLCWLFC